MPRTALASEGQAPELRLRKRNVLLAGFAAVLALLLLSTAGVFQIHRSSSEEAISIYRRHVLQDDAQFRLRRTLWLGASACRDFLLNPFPDRVATFRSQLQKLREDSQRLLAELGRTPGTEAGKPDGGAEGESLAELGREVDDFWNAMAQVPAETEGLDAARRYAFVQREIVPRRDAVGGVLRHFTDISQKDLQHSEEAFERARRLAENRLFLTLGLCVALIVAVAVFSLSHLEKLERETVPVRGDGAGPSGIAAAFSAPDERPGGRADALVT